MVIAITSMNFKMATRRLVVLFHVNLQVSSHRICFRHVMYMSSKEPFSRQELYIREKYRFLPENKDNIKPFMFLQFGAGPRNCSGKTLALTEAKMAIVDMVRNFRFVSAPDREIPPKLQTGGITKPANEMYLKLEAL